MEILTKENRVGEKLLPQQLPRLPQPPLSQVSFLRISFSRPEIEEDKRATTNVQNGLVFFFFYFSCWPLVSL